MKSASKHAFWVFSNAVGWAFGWPFLAPLHRAVLNLSLHALGHDNPRCSGESRFIRTVLKKERVSVCIDIGANVGNYSKELIEMLGATVYAFEPLSSSFAELETLASHYPKYLIPIHAAVGNTNGKATISAKSAKSEKASLELTHNNGGIREEISVTTLDQFVKDSAIERIDFIKVDTEGFELEVFQGMQQTLSDLKPRYIQFEFNINQLQRGYTVFDLAQLLRGYTLFRLLPHGWIRIEQNTFASNIFMFQNIVAVRNE